MPALERYDGPAFKLMRRYLIRPQDNSRVYILSAMYGLIEGGQRIPYYDCHMTSQRALELRPQVTAALECILKDGDGTSVVRRDIFVNLGQIYREAVRDAYEWVSREHSVTYATGSMGSRLAQMHAWLYGPQSLPQVCTHARPRQGSIKLRGVKIDLNVDQVMELALKALSSMRIGAPSDGLTWYVTVGEQRVGPKWLVSQVTGLPVSAFHTDEARRVLKQLGIDVRLNIKR